MSRFFSLIKMLIVNLLAFFGLSLFSNHHLLSDFNCWVVAIQISIFLVSQPPMEPKDFVNPKDGYSMLLIFLGVLVFVNVNVYHYAYLIHTQPRNISVKWIGFLMMSGGLYLRIYAIKVLSIFFSNITEIQDNHQICMVGPYAKLRHPSYTGAIISLLGIVLWFGVFQTTWWTIGLILLVYVYRVSHEEKMLLKHFGKDYENYRKKTRAFI